MILQYLGVINLSNLSGKALRLDDAQGRYSEYLKSTLNTSDEVFKAYGNVNKWICSGSISKGTAVRLVNKTINNINSYWS